MASSDICYYLIIVTNRKIYKEKTHFVNIENAKPHKH